MYKIENKRKQALDAKAIALATNFSTGQLSESEMTSALGAATVKYQTYWLDLQARDAVKQLASILIAELPKLRDEMVLKNENAVAFEVVSDLNDDECLAVLGLLPHNPASIEAEAPFDGKVRQIVFRFQSQLPPVLPRHIEAAQNVRATQRSYFAPNMLGEDKPDTSYHVATINETKGTNTP